MYGICNQGLAEIPRGVTEYTEEVQVLRSAVPEVKELKRE